MPWQKPMNREIYNRFMDNNSSVKSKPQFVPAKQIKRIVPDDQPQSFQPPPQQPNYVPLSDKELTSLICPHDWAAVHACHDLTLPQNMVRVFCTECHIQKVLDINSQAYKNHDPLPSQMTQRWIQFWNEQQTKKHEQLEKVQRTDALQNELLKLQEEVRNQQAILQKASEIETQTQQLRKIQSDIDRQLEEIQERTNFLQEMEQQIQRKEGNLLLHEKSDALTEAKKKKKSTLQLRLIGSKIWGTAKGVAKEVAIRSLTESAQMVSKIIGGLGS